MADLADQASDAAEIHLQEALSKRRATWLRICGYCHWCDETTPNRLFCDAECRDSYDRERDQLARSGRG